MRALAPLGGLTIFAGTLATASGPHSGGFTGQVVHRLTFKGADTLSWAVHQHATIAAIFGVAVIGVWFLRRRRGATSADLEPLTVLGVLLAAQGLIGSVQYELHLPTDMVWVHVSLATVTWLVVLWAWAAEGTLVPRRVAVDASDAHPAAERNLLTFVSERPSLLEELMGSSLGSMRLDLGSGLTAVREYDQVWLERTPVALDREVRWGPWRIRADEPGLNVEALKALKR